MNLVHHPAEAANLDDDDDDDDDDNNDDDDDDDLPESYFPSRTSLSTWRRMAVRIIMYSLWRHFFQNPCIQHLLHLRERCDERREFLWHYANHELAGRQIQNSRTAAELLLSSAYCTTWSLKEASYADLFRFNIALSVDVAILKIDNDHW